MENSNDYEDVLYSSDRSQNFTAEDISDFKTLSSDGELNKESSLAKQKGTQNHSDANEDTLNSTSSPSSKNVASMLDLTEKRTALNIPIPVSTQCSGARGEEAVAHISDKDELTEVMSPRSYSVFKNNLIHVSEMNLPWAPMRTASQCGCGVTFSYSTKKVGRCAIFVLLA